MKKEFLRQITLVRGPLILTILLASLGMVITLAQMNFLSSIVDKVFLGHAPSAQIVPLLFLLLATILVRVVLLWGREVSAQHAAIAVKSALRQRLFAHLLQLGPTYCKGEATGELIATLSEGIEHLDAYISRYLPQIALSILLPLLIAAYILSFDWTSALLLLVTGPIIPLLMILVGSYAEKHVQNQWLALARMSAQLLDMVQGLTTLKLFGRSGSAHQRITQLSDAFRQRTMDALRIAFLSGMVLEFMTSAAIGLIAVTLGIRLLNSGISFQHAFLVLLLTPDFYRPLRELGTHHHASMEGKAAVTRISKILETPILIHPTASSSKHPNSPLSITFTGITYTYTDSTRPALQDINITLPYGTCTAVVGHSGAGKSTLVNLLLRFIEAQDGHVSVNGIQITELPVELWREYIALVPQRPYLFSGSIRDNIALARSGATEQDIEQAAELAGATDFINQLPQGYETEIGERGTRLSAGQLQRLAIARAFLKDAPLLILDEPTSSLDPESEQLIRLAVERLKHNRTVLIIAHRYNTIANADQIVVLENGRLVEVGEPTTLQQQDGVYARLMNTHRMSIQRKMEISL
jgi:ATP-binding cassette subfamily C protein CydD